jgi:hypothetical protein
MIQPAAEMIRSTLTQFSNWSSRLLTDLVNIVTAL